MFNILFRRRIRCKALYNRESHTIDISGVQSSILSKFNFGVGSFKVNTKYKEASAKLMELDLIQFAICASINGISDTKTRDNEIVKLGDVQREMMKIVLDIEHSQLRDINQTFTENKIPSITLSQLSQMQQIDSLLHPNRWKRLENVRFQFSLGVDADRLIANTFKGFMKYLIPYSMFRAFKNKFQKAVIVMIYRQSSDNRTGEFTCISHNGLLIHELSTLLSRKGGEALEQEILLAMATWDVSKKVAFVGGASIEIEYNPDSKLIALGNAPIFEGEDIKNESILTNLLIIDKRVLESIQLSTSKSLAFLGRANLCRAYSNGNLLVTFDLTSNFNFNPNLLRLICQIIDDGKVQYELFRISVEDPEAWDYTYEI